MDWVRLFSQDLALKECVCVKHRCKIGLKTGKWCVALMCSLQSILFSSTGGGTSVQIPEQMTTRRLLNFETILAALTLPLCSYVLYCLYLSRSDHTLAHPTRELACA